MTGGRRVPGLLWGGVAAGPAGVWAQTGPGPAAPRVLWRVDPRTLALTRIGRLECPLRLAVARSVWVLDGCDWSVFRLGAEPVRVPVGASDLAVGAGAVWVAGRRGVYRLDPKKGAIAVRIGTGGSLLAVGETAVWVLDIGNGITGWLRRIDPATNRIVGPPIRLSARQ